MKRAFAASNGSQIFVSLSETQLTSFQARVYQHKSELFQSSQEGKIFMFPMKLPEFPYLLKNVDHLLHSEFAVIP